MQRIKFVWWFVFIGVTLTYWFSINAIDQTLTLWALSKSTLYYTGIMATAMMSLGVVLALRLPFIENLIGGLDLHYRLHKWVGINNNFVDVDFSKDLSQQSYTEVDTMGSQACSGGVCELTF